MLECEAAPLNMCLVLLMFSKTLLTSSLQSPRILEWILTFHNSVLHLQNPVDREAGWSDQAKEEKWQEGSPGQAVKRPNKLPPSLATHLPFPGLVLPAASSKHPWGCHLSRKMMLFH